MSLIESLASAFINTFGITQPTDKARRQAARFIVVLLSVALLVVEAIGALFYRVLHN